MPIDFQKAEYLHEHGMVDIVSDRHQHREVFSNLLSITLKEFKKYNLPFDLLSDIDKSVSKKYCAEGWFMPKRKTILINEKGVVVHIFNDISVEQHGDEILENFIHIQNEK